MDLPGGGTLPLGSFGRRLYQRYTDDGVSDTAAQLSYYLLFALFPALFFLVTLVAYLPLGSAVGPALSRLEPVIPADVMRIIEARLGDLLSQQRPHLLGIGAALALWSASRGVDAFRKALNLAYDVKESRGWVRTQVAAVAVTLLELALVLVTLAAGLLGGRLGFWLANRLGIEAVYATVWSWLRWPLMAMVMMLAAALAYYFLPDVKQKFRYITPGSTLATLVWLAAAGGFSLYAELFGSYDVTYGSIGGVVVLLTWLYLSSFIYILGGEVNAVLEHASRAGKVAGARAEGEVPPPPAERPSAVPPGAAKRADAAERSLGGVT